MHLTGCSVSPAERSVSVGSETWSEIERAEMLPADYLAVNVKVSEK